MLLSRHAQVGLRALGTAQAATDVTLMRVCGFASKKEILNDSLSDAFYDVPTSVSDPSTAASSIDRPLSQDARVRRARSEQAASLMDRGAGILHDSMSDGLYAYRRRSSVADPEYFLHNSLSEGYYEMPSSLRGSSRSIKPRQVRSGERAGLTIVELHTEAALAAPQINLFRSTRRLIRDFPMFLFNDAGVPQCWSPLPPNHAACGCPEFACYLDVRPSAQLL